MPRKPIDITNQRFGTLVAIEMTGRHHKTRDVMWKCLCDCGTYVEVDGASLRRGRTNFCSTCNDNKSKLSPIKGLYTNYKRGAKTRGYVFELTIDDVKRITSQDCYYCGSKPMQFYKKEGAKEGYYYNGIDRQDNDIGYTQDNVVACCKFCNFAKQKFKLEEFEDWIKRLTKYHTIKS